MDMGNFDESKHSLQEISNRIHWTDPEKNLSNYLIAGSQLTAGSVWIRSHSIFDGYSKETGTLSKVFITICPKNPIPQGWDEKRNMHTAKICTDWFSKLKNHQTYQVPKWRYENLSSIRRKTIRFNTSKDQRINVACTSRALAQNDSENRKHRDASTTRWWFLDMLYFHPYLGKIPIVTNMFQMGWNHQLDKVVFMFQDL